jgi:hypothetical protein
VKVPDFLCPAINNNKQNKIKLMSNQHIGHALRGALKATEQMKPFQERKDPATAALCGFFAGGIGLGLYFKSWADFVAPVVLWIFCTLLAPTTLGTSYLAAGTFCAVYGHRRAKASNRKLDEQFSPVVVSSQPPYGGPLPPVIPGPVRPSPERLIEVVSVSPLSPRASESTGMAVNIKERLRAARVLFEDGEISEEELRDERKRILAAI